MLRIRVATPINASLVDMTVVHYPHPQDVTSRLQQAPVLSKHPWQDSIVEEMLSFTYKCMRVCSRTSLSGQRFQNIDSDLYTRHRFTFPLSLLKVF